MTMHARTDFSITRLPRGFTLVELILVIVISGIVAALAGAYINRPVQGYIDMSRRAALVDAAEQALRRMQRDIRRALPNSIRVDGSRRVIEMLNTVDGARYRDDPPPGDPDRRLEFNKDDTQFNLLGQFTNLPVRPFSSTAHYLVVYNVGVPGADAYENLNVITPAGMQIDIDTDPSDATEDHVTLGGTGFRFGFESPAQRIYLVDTPVSYLCDTGAATITRYSSYGITSGQLTTDGALVGAGVGAGTNKALLTNYVGACTFTYDPGTPQRAGLVTMDLTVADSQEKIRLLHQVHVNNVP